MAPRGFRPVLASASVAVALVAGGCGASEEDRVVDVVRETIAAAEDRNAGKLCDLTSKKLKDELREQSDMSCEEAFEESRDAVAKDAPAANDVGEARVNGDKATVEVEGEDDVVLVKEDGEWKLREGDDEGEAKRVEAAIRDLAAAAKAKDFGAVCDSLASDARRQVEDLGQGDCQKTLEKAGEAFTSEIPTPTT